YSFRSATQRTGGYHLCAYDDPQHRPGRGEVISAARRIEGASALPDAARPLWLAASEEFAAWRAGDQRALERLVRLLTPVLWQLARSYGLEREAAEDVV